MSQLFMRRPNLDHLPEIPALPEGYVLRTYQEGDAVALADLMRRAFDDESWTPEAVQERLISPHDVVETFIIAYQGKPVATASARLLPETHPGSGYVHWVGTDPEHQGNRLGYIVSLATLHAFARLGCKDAVLETDDHRIPAIKTYQKLGFHPEHTHDSHPERWARIIADLLAAANI